MRACQSSRDSTVRMLMALALASFVCPLPVAAAQGPPTQPGDGTGTCAIDTTAARAAFEAAMDDDYDTPAALVALRDLAEQIRTARAGGADVQPAQDVLRELTGILGLTLA